MSDALLGAVVTTALMIILRRHIVRRRRGMSCCRLLHLGVIIRATPTRISGLAVVMAGGLIGILLVLNGSLVRRRRWWRRVICIWLRKSRPWVLAGRVVKWWSKRVTGGSLWIGRWVGGASWEVRLSWSEVQPSHLSLHILEHFAGLNVSGHHEVTALLLHVV